MSLFFTMMMQWLKTCLFISHHYVSLDLFDNGLNNGPCATHETEKKKWSGYLWWWQDNKKMMQWIRR